MSYAIAALIILVVMLAGIRIYRKLHTAADLPVLPRSEQVSTPSTFAASTGSTNKPMLKKARALDHKRASN